MKRYEWLTKAPGKLVFAGVASLCMTLSALGQLNITQPAGINIPDFPNTPSAYPQTYAVSNLVGEITKVTVSLNSLTHPYASDVAAMLKYTPSSGSAKSVVLMSDAGGATALKSTVGFEDGKTTLPQFGEIEAGPYSPANYAGLTSFPGGVAGPTGNNLGVFNTLSPNGTWALYVFDDAALPAAPGSLGSWTLTLWTKPLIAKTNDVVTIDEGGEGTFYVNVGSSTVATNLLTVEATSSNPALITNIVASGTGPVRTLTLRPRDFANNGNSGGAATITVKVKDGVSEAETTFTLNVNPVNNAPTIVATNATVTTVAGTVSPAVNLVVNDIDNNASDLRVLVSSSAPTIVAPSGVLFDNASAALRTFTVIPVGTATGEAELTFTVADLAVTNTAAPVKVKVVVNAADHPVFANTTVLGLSEAGTTSSPITVSNIVGKVGKLSVSLNALKGIKTDDISVGLVSPANTVYPLLTSGTAGSGVNLQQVTFDTAGSGSLPGASQITQVKLDAPLDDLAGTVANGVWRLYVTNGGANASVAGGWSVDVWAAPVITTPTNYVALNSQSSTTASFDVTSMNSTVTNKSDITFVVADPSLVSAAVDTFDVASQKGAVKFTSSSANFGTTTVTMTVKDSRNFTTEYVYNVQVKFVNHAPTIDFVQKVITRAGTPTTNVVITVRDQDLTVSNQSLTISGYSDQQKVLPDSNIKLSPKVGGAGTRDLMMFPLGTNTGTINISLVVSDGYLASTNVFQLFVLEAGNPLYWNSGLITLSANGKASPYPVPLNVSGLVGKVEDIQVTIYGINHTVPEELLIQVEGPGVKKNALLLATSGGTDPITSTTLAFSSAASGEIPDAGPIVSGTYLPSVGGTFSNPADWPAGALPSLSVFDDLTGTNLNGVWNLYIQGTGSGKGTIIDGWQLSIKTAPFIAPIDSMAIRESDGSAADTKSVSIRVGDSQPGEPINVTATTQPSGIVEVTFDPAATSTGTTTMKVRPVPFQTGSNVVVTVTASVPGSAPDTETFEVDVYAANLPPVFVGDPAIVGITNSAAQAGNTTFKVWDPQGSDITFEIASDNPRVVPVENITIPTTPLETSNGTNTYGILVIPSGTETGVSRITVRAVNSFNLKRTTTFYVDVKQALVVMNNDGAITIPEGRPVNYKSNPYGSVAHVSGLDGFVTGVEVTILGLTHSYPSDVSMLLVNPENTKGVILMARAGDAAPVNNYRLSFKDGATAIGINDPLVNNTTYKPVSFAAGLNFEVPGLGTDKYSTNLASFVSSNPNGDWKLYVMDDAYPIGGTIANWILTLQTSPAFVNVADQTTLQNTPIIVPVTVVDQSSKLGDLTVTATAGQSTPTNAFTLPTPVSLVQTPIQVTNVSGGTWNVVLLPTPNLPSARTNVNGAVPIYLAVDDGTGFTNRSNFTLTVVVSNEPPVIVADPAKLAMTENLVGQTPAFVTGSFSITDVDSGVNVTNATIAFDNSDLVPNDTNHLVVTYTSSSAVSVKLVPVIGKYGTNNLTLTFDGVTKTVPVEVANVYQAPYFEGLAANYTTPAGQLSLPFTFTVGSTEGVPGKNLIVTAASGTPSVIPANNVRVSPSGDSRSVLVLPLGTVSGPAVVNLTVIDPDGKKTNTAVMNITVTPPAPGLFGNGEVVSIAGNPNFNPNWAYPLVFNVTNLVGPIWSVAVEMRGFSNSSPANLDALLVGPDQTAVSLMSGGGGTDPVNALDLRFADGGAEMPLAGPLTSDTYHPSYYTKRLLPTKSGDPAPTTNTIYQTRLAAFANKTDYLGDWKLYLNQAATNTYARIGDGIFLTIIPAPWVTNTFNAISMDENQETNVVIGVTDSIAIWGTNLQVTAVSDKGDLLPVSNPVAVAPGVNNLYNVAIKPNLYKSGVANITVTAKRLSDNAVSSSVIQVNVGAKNWPPSFASRLLPVSTPASQPIEITFLVTDPDTPISSPTNMMVKATSRDQNLIADANLVFLASGSNIVKGLPPSKLGPQTAELVLRLSPNQFAIGTNLIDLEITDTMTDGVNVVTTNFVFMTEDKKFAPIVGTVPNQTVIAGRSVGPLQFTATSPNNPAPYIRVTASSGNTTLIPNGNISIQPSAAVQNQTNWNIVVTAQSQAATFQPTPVTITLTASDTNNVLSTSTTFVVTVLPAPLYVFDNGSKSVAIRDNNTADPYPSEILIEGMLGTIADVNVTLNGYYHSYPADVNVLLVGPEGQKVVLMNKAGGGTPIRETNAINLTFDMSASSAIPQGPLSPPYVYDPQNYNNNFDFPGEAPKHPYSVNLGDFNGTSPNGAWKLYVVDDGAPDSGAIKSGWTLTIETQPELTLSTNLLAMNMGTSGSLNLTIADDAPAGEYKFGFTSTNATLLPAGSVKVTGTGADYTVAVTPESTKWGTNLVTLWVTNILNQYVSTQFGLHVLLVTNPPVVLPVADVNTIQGGSAATELVFGDALINADQLVVSFESSNPGLVPPQLVRLASAPAGATGLTTNSILVTALGSGIGTADITVRVKAPDSRGGLQSTQTFTVNVLKSATPVIANTGQIIINDRAPATPYANSVVVSGVQGTVRKVWLDIVGLEHSYPNDISMMLVGPGNKKVILMSRAGNGVPITNTVVTFADNGSTMPTSSPIVSGTYKPSNYNPVLNFYPDSGIPSGTAVTNLSEFNGGSPNGTWTLYVQDDATPDAGRILGGWTLRLETTAPTIESIADQTTLENVALNIPIKIGTPVANISNLVVTATSSGVTPAGLVPATLPVAINATNKALGTITITPAPNMPSAVTNVNGTATITVSVTDGTNTASTTFPLTVIWVNQKPTISGLTDLTTPANVSVSKVFQVTDPDSPAADLDVVGYTSSNADIGTVAITGVGVDRNLSFTPNGTTGQTLVTIVTTDKLTFGTNTVTITAAANLPTQISNISDRTVDESTGTALVSVNFTVTYKTPDTVISGSADNSSLVSGVSVRGLGNNYNAAITLNPYVNGQAIISIVASNQFGSTTEDFKVTVNPVDYAPTLAPISPVTAQANTTVIVPLTVSDPDTALSALTFTTSIDRPELVKGMAIVPTETNATLTIMLAECQSGNASVTVTVADTANTVSQKLSLTVQPPLAPSIGAIDDITVTNSETETITVPIIVTAGDVALEQLTVTTSNSNTQLVSAVELSMAESNLVATITLVADVTGVSTIGINVSDCYTTVTETFKVTVPEPVPPTLTVTREGAKLNITFTGTPGAEYTLQTSTNLSTWTDGESVTTDANGNGSFSVDITTAGTAFFRTMRN